VAFRREGCGLDIRAIHDPFIFIREPILYSVITISLASLNKLREPMLISFHLAAIYLYSKFNVVTGG
jgi:hypothetical protein